MATSLRSLRLTIMCVVLVLFLGLVMLRAHLTEKDLRLQEADALRAAVLAELDAHRNGACLSPSPVWPHHTTVLM